jgi:hypothetical protein
LIARLTANKVTVRRIPTIAEALNTPDWQWTGAATVLAGSASHDGVAAVAISTVQDVYHDYYPGALQTIVHGPGLLSFWMKTRAGKFEVNGVDQTVCSGVLTAAFRINAPKAFAGGRIDSFEVASR